MKKILIVLMLFIGMNAQAQEVYNELRQKNRTIVENPQTNDLVRNICQFKLDALTYLAIKKHETKSNSSEDFLDEQALAMDSYVNFYTEKYVEYYGMPESLLKEITKIFIDTSLNTPLFKDKDKELVLSYYDNSKALIRFSLDTDWIKAYEYIKKALKKDK